MNYIQIRDNTGTERFIESGALDGAISAGEVVAFRRSDGWVNVSAESLRGVKLVQKRSYAGQERRRFLLSRRKITPGSDDND
jgi:hypothetical protein